MLSSSLTKLQKVQTEASLKKEASFVAQRKYVGNIIISVLTERIIVRRGLELFPKGCEDESVKTAWHALCHYEADEDIRKQDVEYNNEQVSFYKD